MAATPVDMHIHDTYFIVAHIHYVLFGGSTFGIFAAIYYWFPKMFGRMMNERLGKVHFVLTFLTFNGTFFLMHIIGMHGHPRRIADPTIYPFLNGPGIVGMNQFMTYQRLRPGADADPLRGQLPLQPGLRPEGPGQPLARQHPGMGARPRRRPTTTSRRSRPSTTRPTSTASRASWATTCPRPSPGRRSPGRWTRSWPDAGLDRPPRPDERPMNHDPEIDDRLDPNAGPRLPARPALVRAPGDGLHLAPAVRRRPGDDLPGRHGRARLADDVRHEHVPLRHDPGPLGGLRRAHPPALRGGGRALHDPADARLPGLRPPAVDEVARAWSRWSR